MDAKPLSSKHSFLIRAVKEDGSLMKEASSHLGASGRCSNCKSIKNKEQREILIAAPDSHGSLSLSVSSQMIRRLRCISETTRVGLCHPPLRRSAVSEPLFISFSAFLFEVFVLDYLLFFSIFLEYTQLI